LLSGSAPARLPKMNRLEKARWRNILRKAAKANRLLKKGYLVFDHYGNRFDGFKFSNGELYQGSKTCKMMWASKDGRWGSALDTSIKKYNADRFNKWTAVHPKHIKKI
jgi:hypothetical protein